MNKKQLGEKIKEIRLAKKMTQSEVVGTYITRNMLSQIESGAANPSIKTLEYLAHSLGVPLNKIIGDGTDVSQPPADNEELCTLVEAKKAYSDSDYNLVVELMSPVYQNNTPLFDEGVALLARCYLKMAEESMAQESYQKAAHEAQKAAELSGEGVYSSREIKTQSLILLDRISDNLTRMHIVD